MALRVSAKVAFKDAQGKDARGRGKDEQGKDAQGKDAKTHKANLMVPGAVLGGRCPPRTPQLC